MNSRIIASIVLLTLVLGCTDNPSDTTTTTLIEDCVISMCDCKCHPAGTTREETEGVLCGVNCYGIHGLIGCELVNDECTEIYETTTTQPQQVANPASVNCIVNGGSIELSENENGVAGLCVFQDDSVCDEWAYFRNECAPGDNPIQSCDVFGFEGEGPFACTLEYAPACGRGTVDGEANWKTYGNACGACANVEEGVDGYIPGEC